MPSPAPSPRRRLPAAALAAALAALPGLLAGALLTGLLFFLNPDAAFTPATVARGVVLYGALLAVAAAALLAPLHRLDPRRAARGLPWAVTAVLAGAAAASWYHASHYSFFLPPGIDTRLIKAALSVSLAALIAFYTALLHSVNRRPYGPRSRWGLLALALASVYFLVERREAFTPRPEAAPLPAAVASLQRPQLVVVGLEGATLDAVLPLAEQGQLPFFARLLQEGAHGRLASLPPTVTAALWTTLATGKLPYRHRIVGRQRWASPLAPGDELALLPRGLGFRRWGLLGGGERAVDGRDRRALALWEMLGRLELASGVVGWPAAHPAKAPVAFAFSDRYFADDPAAAEARPPDLVARGRMFRIAPRDVDPALIAELRLERERRAMVGALSADLWREAMSSFLLDQTPQLQAFFLRLTGLAHVSSASFGGFAAATFEGSRRADARAAAAAVAAYYRRLDGVLAELWAERRGPTILVVVSPHGFTAPAGWRRLLGLVGGSRLEGRLTGPPDGALFLLGEGIQPGQTLAGVELVDLAPTLLYALGLPTARDLDGRVLTEAFTPAFLARAPLAVVPSYEALVPAGRGD